MPIDCSLGRDPDQPRWNAIWAAWTVGTLTTLVAAEVIAVRAGGRGSCTLTAVTRRATGIHPRTDYAPAAQLVVCGLCALLAKHLITGR